MTSQLIICTSAGFSPWKIEPDLIDSMLGEGMQSTAKPAGTASFSAWASEQARIATTINMTCRALRISLRLYSVFKDV